VQIFHCIVLYCIVVRPSAAVAGHSSRYFYELNIVGRPTATGDNC